MNALRLALKRRKITYEGTPDGSFTWDGDTGGRRFWVQDTGPSVNLTVFGISQDLAAKLIAASREVRP